MRSRAALSWLNELGRFLRWNSHRYVRSFDPISHVVQVVLVRSSAEKSEACRNIYVARDTASETRMYIQCRAWHQRTGTYQNVLTMNCRGVSMRRRSDTTGHPPKRASEYFLLGSGWTHDRTQNRWQRNLDRCVTYTLVHTKLQSHLNPSITSLIKEEPSKSCL